MVLGWNTTLALLRKRWFTGLSSGNLDELVNTVYEYTPDWAKPEEGLRRSKLRRRFTPSGYHQKVAVIGST